MSTTEVTDRDGAVGRLTDRLELQDLLGRLGAWLDGHGGDPRHVYTEDVVASGPRGDIRGIDAVIARVDPANDTDERAQHFHTDVLVDLAGETASITANQLVYAFREDEVPHRTAGLRVAYGARRTPDGWRLSDVDIVLQGLVGEMPN